MQKWNPKTEFWCNKMLSGWLKTVIRIKAPVPACCRLQCLRRSSRTRWGRRPLETGPCWTRSADRSSRRLRLPLWPAFSWSRPWLQTRSRFKAKGDWGLGAADILSLSKEEPCKARCSSAVLTKRRTQPTRTNLQLLKRKKKIKIYTASVHKWTRSRSHEVKSLSFWLLLRSDEEPFFHHVTFPFRCVWPIPVRLQLAATNKEPYGGRWPSNG